METATITNCGDRDCTATGVTTTPVVTAATASSPGAPGAPSSTVKTITYTTEGTVTVLTTTICSTPVGPAPAASTTTTPVGPAPAASTTVPSVSVYTSAPASSTQTVQTYAGYAAINTQNGFTLLSSFLAAMLLI